MGIIMQKRVTKKEKVTPNAGLALLKICLQCVWNGFQGELIIQSVFQVFYS